MEEVLGARRRGWEGKGRKHRGAHPAGRSVGANTAPLRGPQGEGPRGGEPRGPLGAGVRRFYPGATRGARANPKGKQKVMAQAASSGEGRVTPGRWPVSSAGGAPGSGAGAARLRAGAAGMARGGQLGPGPVGREAEGFGLNRGAAPGSAAGREGTRDHRAPALPRPAPLTCRRRVAAAGCTGAPPPAGPRPSAHHFRDALGTPEDPRLGGSAGGSGLADGRKPGIQGDLHGAPRLVRLWHGRGVTAPWVS